jgi:Undecaprenyl-phosphate galactose phosphotransferase WbaP
MGIGSPREGYGANPQKVSTDMPVATPEPGGDLAGVAEAAPTTTLREPLARRRFYKTDRLVTPLLIASDLLLGGAVLAAASLLRSIWGDGHLSDVSISVGVAVVAVWVGMRALLGLYPGYGLSRAEELRLQTYAVFSTLAIIAVAAVVLQVGDLISRLLLVLAFLGLLVIAPLARYAVKWRLMKSGMWGKPVALMGCGTVGVRLIRLLKKEWELGFNPIAVFDEREVPAYDLPEGVPYGGTLADATHLARDHGVSTVIFAMPHIGRKHLARYVDLVRLNFRHVVVVPNLAGITNSAVVARDFAGILGVEVRYNLLDPRALRMKRVLDLVMTITGGIVILPLILIISALVWMESGGQVYYRAQRMGRNGKLFSCVKFRTMVPDAEDLLQRLLSENAEARKEYAKYHKLRDDPRVTRIGRVLRKTSLDELPQLWNVLRGEMSLVGPRPYLPRESADIGLTQNEILRVPPGITGPWQVSGRNNTSFDERVQMDADYVHNWSVWMDLTLLARTVTAVLMDRATY